LKKYPKTERAPEGMLKLGLSLLSLGQQKEGCVALAALPKTYPNAAPAIAARAKTEAKNAACG
jgi:TolA-binding protein